MPKLRELTILITKVSIIINFRLINNEGTPIVYRFKSTSLYILIIKIYKIIDIYRGILNLKYIYLDLDYIIEE
jgi:hypothetical protein